MEENINESRTDYEPNFILKDPEPIAENPSFVTADTIQDDGLSDIFSEEELRGAGINVEEVLGKDVQEEQSGAQAYGGEDPFAKSEQPQTPTEEEGRYRDPRENFRPSAGAAGAAAEAGASARWSGGRARAEGGNFFSQGASGAAGGAANAASAASKNIGDIKRKLKKTRKPSKPVTMSRKALGLLIASCMAISCVFGIGGGYIGSHMDSSPTANTAATETADMASSAGEVESAGYNLQSATGSNMTIQEITKTAQKSVVEIRTEGMVSDSWMQQYVTEGAGSGVIISKDGYIMTNNHVIDGANKITVTTSDKHSYEATLVGTDQTNDVAVLKIKATGLTPAVYGNSDQLQVGDNRRQDHEASADRQLHQPGQLRRRTLQRGRAAHRPGRCEICRFRCRGTWLRHPDQYGCQRSCSAASPAERSISIPLTPRWRKQPASRQEMLSLQ